MSILKKYSELKSIFGKSADKIHPVTIESKAEKAFEQKDIKNEQIIPQAETNQEEFVEKISTRRKYIVLYGKKHTRTFTYFDELNGRYRTIKLHRILAQKNIDKNVTKGTLGGWVEHEGNLDQDDNCWIYDDAMVFGNAQVLNRAKIKGDAQVYGNAIAMGWAYITGHAKVRDNAWVCDHGSVGGLAEVSGCALINESACVYCSAKVCDRAIVSGFAKIGSKATVSDDAQIKGEAYVIGTSTISGNAVIDGNTEIYKNTQVRDAIITGNTTLSDDVEVFGNVTINPIKRTRFNKTEQIESYLTRQNREEDITK